MNKTYMTPIDSSAAKLSMLLIGVLMFITGIAINDIAIMLNGESVKDLYLLIIVIVAFLIQMLELGIKKYTHLSKLKKFKSQQIVTFSIAVVALVSTLLSFFGIFPQPSSFTGGLISTMGIFVVVEAFV